MLRNTATCLCILLAIGGLSACQSQPSETVQPSETPEEVTYVTEDPALVAVPNGMECIFTGADAAVTIGDKRLNFSCLEEDTRGTALIGDIQLTDQGWAIEKVDYVTDGVTYTAQTSNLVKIMRIVVDDGSECVFTGTGATTSLGDKRLNFFCGMNEDYTIGLFGDVSLGENGWEITKGEVKLTESNLLAKDVVQAVIDSLVVAQTP